MSTLINSLPEINFAEKDVSIIESEIITEFERLSGRKLYPGDPLRLLLLSFAKYISLQRNLIDFSGKQNLLKYAVDGYLDNLAALPGISILQPSKAMTTLKFMLSAARESTIIIEKGTRATPGNNIHFETIEHAEILAGEISIEVPASCLIVGEIGNGFYPGQINKLSDPFPYFCEVNNITISQGGADIEDTNSFRERIRQAPESYSSAGPHGAYVFWAKTASQLIDDVSVVSPSPGVVEIIPLLKNGEIPTEDILDAVYSECNDDKRRPLTDMVVVKSPNIKKYDIEVEYYISRKNASVGLSIQNKFNSALENFTKWQKSKLGRDLNPSKLIEMAMETGIKRIDVLKPEFTSLDYYEVAIPENVLVACGGFEDD